MSIAEDLKNGLWYNSSNEYVWGCRDCAGDALWPTCQAVP